MNLRDSQSITRCSLAAIGDGGNATASEQTEDQKIRRRFLSSDLLIFCYPGRRKQPRR
jgi:hypothetical protein